jgi:hypothetical protein
LGIGAAGSSEAAKFKSFTSSNDPDILSPHNTTGGQIGFALGVIIGTVNGGPSAGLVAGAKGAAIGHGIDRVITRVSNDITGPLWKDLENGFIGKALGDAGKGISNSFKKWF